MKTTTKKTIKGKNGEVVIKEGASGWTAIEYRDNKGNTNSITFYSCSGIFHAMFNINRPNAVNVDNLIGDKVRVEELEAKGGLLSIKVI